MCKRVHVRPYRRIRAGLIHRVRQHYRRPSQKVINRHRL